MPSRKRQFTLRLDEDNFLKIKYIAQQNRRSTANQIEFLIEQHIREWEKTHGEIDVSLVEEDDN
uniref:Arc family DNA-binding protein n=1 Tax=Fervidobacterium pennivorans TaxID=93466 RepID=A0A7V4NF17_FERPE